MGVEQAVEKHLVDILHMRHHPADAGIVDQNVDLAEFGFRFPNGAFHVADDAIVGLKAQWPQALFMQLGGGLIEIALFEIGNCDLGAALAKHAGMRQAKPGAAAGDQDGVAVERFGHVSSLECLMCCSQVGVR